jgi:hypothetical protein
MNDVVHALIVWDDGGGEALWAGGYFSDADGVSVDFVAKWDGTRWRAGPRGISDWGCCNPPVTCFAIHDDGGGEKLYIGGEFYRINGELFNNIAAWDGRNWSNVGFGFNDEPLALVTHDDGTGPALYAGGWFVFADDGDARNIARWDGDGWTTLDEGMTSPVLSLLPHGGLLYVGGAFEFAGPQLSCFLARWGCEEQERRGDMNCDGSIDFDDVDAFVVAIIGQAEYEAAYPDCRYLNGDIDSSGGVDFDDIDPFVTCIIDGGC